MPKKTRTWWERYGRRQKIAALALLAFSACAKGAPTIDPGKETPEDVGSTTELDELIAEAIAAEQRGNFLEALSIYEEIEQSKDPWYAWVGTSARVALYREMGAGEEARRVTAQVKWERPELEGLMALWDGDTAALEGDFSRAAWEYETSLETNGNDLIDGQPIGVLSLRQLSRLSIVVGAPAKAAELQRRLVSDYAEFVNPEVELARAVVFDAMAHGELPLKPLGELLHDGDCSLDRPCLLQAGYKVSAEASSQDVLMLGGLEGIQFILSPQDEELLNQTGEPTTTRRMAPRTATACTVPSATDGFMSPMANDHYGYHFMESPDITGGYHPGVDQNGPGYSCEDTGINFVAVARGCVTDAGTSTWGSATVRHRYEPDNQPPWMNLWTSQYGHADAVYYSVGAAISKGAALGSVGKVGTVHCHLHHEIREQDHPSPSDADYYSTASQTNVGDWYQDPDSFVLAHRSYSSFLWWDESAFTFTGSWILAPSPLGDLDDMKYASSSTTKTAWARYPVSSPTYANGTFITLPSGTYELWMFVPWNYATSSAVPVKVINSTTGQIVMSKNIPQISGKDSWMQIGTAYLAFNPGSYIVEVANNTGEIGKKVGIDDFLLIRHP